MTAIYAQVLAQWRSRWNTRWRFSRGKLGFWLFLGQIGLTGVLVWRLGGAAAGNRAGSPWVGSAASVFVLPLLAIALQASLAGFLTGFSQGRQRLYTNRFVDLVHLTPAPTLSPLVAHLGAELPGRAGSALVMAVGLGVLLPLPSRLVGIVLLWLIGLMAGLLSLCAGLLVLVGWVRLAPRTLDIAWNGMLFGFMALFLYLGYAMAVGTPLTTLAGMLVRVRLWLIGGLVVLFGVPGLGMALWLAVSPQGVAAAYREGWLNLAETADGAAGPRRSRWPALAGGSAGAVQVREWLQVARNPVTFMRMGAWLAGQVVVWVSGPALARLTGLRHDLWLLAAGVGLAHLGFLELVGALFSAGGSLLPLAVVAGTRPGRLLLGKALAALPVALAAAAGSWVAAAASGAPVWQQFRLAALAGAIGLGMVLTAVGLAALGASLQDDQTEAGSNARIVFEQVPRGMAAWTAMAAATGFAAAAVWLVVGAPGVVNSATTKLWAGSVTALPPLAMVLGYRSLRHLFAGGHERY